MASPSEKRDSSRDDCDQQPQAISMVGMADISRRVQKSLLADPQSGPPCVALPGQPPGKLPNLPVHIRWMIRRDMPEVYAIENESFEFPWGEEEFINCLRQRNCIGMVCEHAELVVGYMIYELHKNRLHILNFAVAARFRRRGVASAMIRKLAWKLSPQRRTKLMLEIRETNLPAQLFFKAAGFRAISVLRDFYDDTTEDAYLMQYRYKAGDAILPSAADAVIRSFDQQKESLDG